MNALTTVKTRTQESWNHLVETAQQQPTEVQKWGVVAASAIVGGVAVAAGAKGVLAIVSLLAAPPVAITVGALGGGALGWSYMQGKLPLASANADVPVGAPVIA